MQSLPGGATRGTRGAKPHKKTAAHPKRAAAGSGVSGREPVRLRDREHEGQIEASGRRCVGPAFQTAGSSEVRKGLAATTR